MYNSIGSIFCVTGEWAGSASGLSGSFFSLGFCFLFRVTVGRALFDWCYDVMAVCSLAIQYVQ